MQIHYEESRFMRDFTTRYLRWLSEEVRKHDVKTDLHVNPHMLFSNLADYDFNDYQEFLSHIGASMHPSWHFGYFDRKDYSLAISANCEMMRTGAGNLPFWVTELQGGNNNFSGYNPLMPTSTEIAQWMWTAIAAGTEGIIFWTLNPRAAGFEAGEWALLDFQKQPTERLEMAGKIAKLLNDSPGLNKIQPQTSNIYLLYSPESLVLQRNSEIESNQVRQYYAARQEGAHVKSLLAYYKVLEQHGIGSQIYHMGQFDWSCDPRGKTIVLANMAIIPRTYYTKIDSFVKRGGKLFVTGQTAHFDEYVYNVMYGEWPLRSLFGGELKAFRSKGDLFSIKVGKHLIKGHFLEGLVRNLNAEIISQNDQGEITGVYNKYGQGEVVWIPSMLGLAYWNDHDLAFSDLVMEYCGPFSNEPPFLQSGVDNGMVVKNFKDQNDRYSLIINKTGRDDILPYNTSHPPEEILFQLKRSHISEAGLIIKENDCVVVKWPKERND
jgi:beta-galactosidase